MFSTYKLVALEAQTKTFLTYASWAFILDTSPHHETLPH